jgi:hypothetical protein
MSAFLRIAALTAVISGSAAAADPVVAPPSVLPASALEHQVVDLTPAELPGRPAPDYIDHSADCRPGGWFSSGEYLLWRPRLSDSAYALVDPVNDNVPQGRVHSVHPDVGNGLRTTLGYRFASGWDVGFTYTYLFADGAATAFAPDGGVLYPQLTRPGVVDKALAASAATRVEYNVFDIDFGRTVTLDPNVTLRAFAGVRFAAIDADVRARYDGLQANDAFAGSWSRFTGAGPTAGAEVRWALGRYLTLFGGGRGGLIYGSFHGDQLETNAGDAVLVTDLRDHYTGVAPMISAQLGGSWQWNWLSLAAGYEVTHWFNVASRPSPIDDFAEGKLQRRRSDLSFDGVFFRVGINY